MRLMQHHLDKALGEHDRIVKLYRNKYSEDRKTRDGKRDWRTYEQRLALRIKTAAQELEPIIMEAYSMIKTRKGKGADPKISVPKKIMILLLKDIFQLSNRKMANFLAFFTALSGIDISYKTVERIYSNELARMTIHNTFLLMVKRKEIKEVDASGDGTGYSLTITKHYRTEREKELKSEEKEEQGKEKSRDPKEPKTFARSFALIDLDTGMYVGYGASMRSEHDAFHKAMDMARENEVIIKSARLDRLFSYQSITKELDPNTKIYIIPKKNALIKGSAEWHKIMRSYTYDTLNHLREYFKREASESGFSADKRSNGWKICQKKDERIELALICKGVWHNLFRLV